MEDCKKCHGTRYIPCDACKGGLMEVPCPECDGDGWFTEPGVDKTSSCKNCHGEGDLDPENCSVCHGEKLINCPDCDGTGEVPVKEQSKQNSIPIHAKRMDRYWEISYEPKKYFGKSYLIDGISFNILPDFLSSEYLSVMCGEPCPTIPWMTVLLIPASSQFVIKVERRL